MTTRCCILATLCGVCLLAAIGSSAQTVTPSKYRFEATLPSPGQLKGGFEQWTAALATTDSVKTTISRTTTSSVPTTDSFPTTDSRPTTASPSAEVLCPQTAEVAAVNRTCVLKPPYLAALHSEEWLRHDFAPLTRWVPVSFVTDGADVFTAIQKAADSPAICKDSLCHGILRSFGGTKETARVQGYSYCASYVAKNGMSAPSCAPVALMDRDQVWLLAVVGKRPPPPPPPPPMPQAYPVSIGGTKLPSMDKIEDAVAKALARPILSLSIVPVPVQDSLKAMALPRPSLVNPPWREWATVRVDLVPNGSGITRYVSFYPDITLYVNRQNTPDPSDWRMPSQDQQARFNQAVVKALKQTLSSLCPQGTWHIDSVLMCN